MNPIRYSSLLYVAVLLTMAACQTATPTQPTAVPPTASLIPPTAVLPTTTPTPSLPTAIPATAGPTPTNVGILTTFVTERLKLPLSVSFDEQWRITDNFNELLTLELHQGSGEIGQLSFNVVSQARFADPNGSGTIPWPDDFVANLQSNPHLLVGHPTAVTIDGFKGVQIDVLVMATGKKQMFIQMQHITWNYLYDTEQWRFIMLDDVNGERLLIGIVGSAEEFSTRTELAQKVLDTVEFAEPNAETSAQTAFSSSKFKIPMSVNVGPDWLVTDDYRDLVTVENTDVDLAVAFNIVTDAKLADPIDGHLIPFPEDFVSWIKSNPDFTAIEVTQVKVGGLAGVQVDATPIATRRKLFLSLKGIGWNLVDAATNPEHWRFIDLGNVNGERLMILTIEPADSFQSLVPEVQKILDSVVFPNG